MSRKLSPYDQHWADWQKRFGGEARHPVAQPKAPIQDDFGVILPDPPKTEKKKTTGVGSKPFSE